jgi:hypothetical protein
MSHQNNQTSILVAQFQQIKHSRKVHLVMLKWLFIIIDQYN